ncbi:MAG: PaaI family thioesterase [Bacillota bacterium]
MKEDRLEIYREIIDSTPVHRFLGVKIESMGDNQSTVSIPADSHTLNAAGNLHGGVTYLVSDVAAFAALGPSLSGEEFCVTIDYNCSIYRATSTGPVVFRARVATRTRRLAFINVSVTDEKNVLLAEARVTKAITRSVPGPFKNRPV